MQWMVVTLGLWFSKVNREDRETAPWKVWYCSSALSLTRLTLLGFHLMDYTDLGNILT